MQPIFFTNSYFTVDSLIWRQSATDFLQNTIYSYVGEIFLAKCPAELCFLLAALWRLISLRAFESEKRILIASAKYNVSWQNSTPSREGPSRFELNSGFQRWQICSANSHRHLVLPIAGKGKKKNSKGIWFKSWMPSLQMKIEPQTLTGLEFSWHAALLPSRDNRNVPLTIPRFIKTKRCYCTRQCIKCQWRGITSKNWLKSMLHTNLVCYQWNTVKCQNRGLAQTTMYIHPYKIYAYELLVLLLCVLWL